MLGGRASLPSGAWPPSIPSSRSDRSSATSPVGRASSARRLMASVDVPVALLGYGTVGSAVNRLLHENADDIERATGHRLRVVKALVREPAKERAYQPDPEVLTTDFESILKDESIALVAEVMGGVEPTGGYVLDLLQAGRPGVSANKEPVAPRGAGVLQAAS